LTFPDDEDFIAEEAEFFEVSLIAFNISPAFIPPEFCICGRCDSAKTTAVYEYFATKMHKKTKILTADYTDFADFELKMGFETGG
jgi:hypothetical protein